MKITIIESRTVFLVLICFMVNLGKVSAQPQGLPELAQGQSIQETLKIVASQNKPIPAQISVSLKNGAKFSGSVSSFTQSKNTLSLKNQNGEVTLIDLDSVAAVTIIAPGSALNALRGNKIFREENSTIPSRLTMVRRVEAYNAANPVAIKLGFSASDYQDENCRFYTSRVIDEVEAALKQAAEDELGRDAIAKLKSGFSIIHQANSELTVTNNSDALVLSFDCTSPLFSNFGETIEAKVNEVL